MEEKVFVIFNTTNIGDVLVTNTLIQNIKNYYPESKIVFVCKTNIHDVAKYQDGVDDVVTYDKNTLKGIRKIYKFSKQFPYQKPFASFVTYSNERNLIISRLIGSKHIISHHKFKLWNTKEKYELKDYHHIKARWGGMIEAFTGEHKNLPIKYLPPEVDNLLIQKIKNLKNPVPISATSNFYKKDMKPADCIELIHLLNINGFTPIITGAGDTAKNFVNDIKRAGCFDFIDLVDCTSFVELANILKICGCCISVDTGTMHFANALQVPVIGIFYAESADIWGSDPELYPSKMLEGKDIKPADIIREFKELIGVRI